MTPTTVTFPKNLTAKLSALQDKKDEKENPEITAEMFAKLVTAIENDKKINGKYTSYTGRFIILGAIKKYGNNAKFAPKTVVTALQDYKII